MLILTWFLLSYFALYATYAIVTGLFSKRLMKKLHGRPLTDPSRFVDIPVSIVVPAYNEEVVLQETLRNLTQQTYPNYDIIVVNDGSTDSTYELLHKWFNLESTQVDLPLLPTKLVRATWHAGKLPGNCRGIFVVDKMNGGKADAFNAALNVTRSKYIMTVDADTVLTPNALVEMMTPVLLDPHVVAVGAQVGVMNNSELNAEGAIVSHALPKNWLQGVQAIEYLKTFLIYRTGHNAAGASLLISGACGLFETKMLMQLYGFDTTAVCEDIEITLRIQAYVRKNKLPKRIDFVVNPVAWTEVPEKLSSLNKQRNRWFRGAAHALWKFKGVTLNPSMGAIGWFSVPTYWLFGYLSPFALLLLSGLLIFQALAVNSWTDAGALLVVGVLVAFVINLLALSMLKYTTFPMQTWRDKARLFWYGIVELVFVQFIYMFIYLKAAFDALLGKRQWNKFARVGFHVVEATPDE